MHVAEALLATAVLARHQGDFNEAAKAANESVAVAQAAGFRPLEARALGTLANIALVQRDLPRAAKLLARTEVLFRELGDDSRVATTLTGRSVLALQTGDAPTAYALANESRSLSRERGDRTNVVSADLNLSLAARSLGRHETSRQVLAEALELAREVGDPGLLAEALIVAAATIVSRDPGAARALVDVADRARGDLMLELDPVEQEIRDDVQRELRRIHPSEIAVDLSEGDLSVVLDTAAARALEALAEAASDDP